MNAMLKTLPWNRPADITPLSCEKLANAIAELKTRLQDQYERVLPGQTELVRDTIAAAEALAWLTPFPHLFLPDLAEARIASLASQSASPEMTLSPPAPASLKISNPCSPDVDR